MDDNDKQVLYGVSHIDGETLVKIAFDPSSRSMLVDSVTEIEFDPTAVNPTITDNGYPVAMATSSDDNATIRPWVVNATTGAVLIDT